jgi:hypothetical protein
LGQRIKIEKEFIKPCAKGAADISAFGLLSPGYVLWPYDESGELMTESFIAQTFPLAWKYLNMAKAMLLNRSISGKWKQEWWQFGRKQGIEVQSKVKVLVPSLYSWPGIGSYEDRKGSCAFTASGKGGGGGYALIPNEESTDVRWITAIINSKLIWEWIKIEADPQKSSEAASYRGLDQSVISRIPYAKLPSRRKTEFIRAYEDLLKSVNGAENEEIKSCREQIELIVMDAFRVKKTDLL